MQKSKKNEVVRSLTAVFNDASFIVLSQYGNLSVNDATKLRRSIRHANGKCVVVKNNLAKIAIKNTQYEAKFPDSFSGPTMIAYCNGDYVGVSKALVKFTENNDKIKLLAAATNAGVVTIADIQNIAVLPPVEELRAKLCGNLVSPMSSVLQVLVASQQKMLGVLDAYVEKLSVPPVAG